MGARRSHVCYFSREQRFSACSLRRLLWISVCLLRSAEERSQHFNEMIGLSGAFSQVFDLVVFDTDLLRACTASRRMKVAAERGARCAPSIICATCAARTTFALNSRSQAARFDRSSANAALPVRVASDIVSKNSDCRTGLLFPAV
jgi:hypothetical protein